MSKSYAAIVGGAAGVVLVAGLIILWFCKSHFKNFSNKNSETGSSDPYPIALGEWNRRGRSSSTPSHPLFGPQVARQFTMDELEQATKQFNESNLIGYGSFGSVYKGLLHDTIVAIKRRPGAPREDFVTEVLYLSDIRHRNLVSLLGYCQERGSQMLVFDYIPNGSMCNHLYGLNSSTKLEFKQRLSIALGAAKGLCHLHGLNPPLVHSNFKTANVLVDENFIVKVAEAGISKLLEKIEEAGPSYTSSVNVFQDPEIGVPRNSTAMSDIYSFGVFLLELITGQEAVHLGFLGSDESLIQWMESGI
ncbi:hypothetical protein MANES_15G014900v8 [Manihot esculenta]|uniref:Uncharacterized protein n=1 Tax=Manihot esculenta TaxID=3983 RepID=A0ACB7GAP4_MANES|nr:hypothetical protein MANES_15G014900v8 [Manihot esculenta]